MAQVHEPTASKPSASLKVILLVANDDTTLRPWLTFSHSSCTLISLWAQTALPPSNASDTAPLPLDCR
jgi:hypothetical protein